MTRPAGVILDYGNVLSRPQDQTWFEPAAARIGASVEAFRSAYWRYRHDYDAGLPVDQYWQRVLAAARPGRDGVPRDGELAWLIERDIASWSVYHDEVWALAARFREAGGRTAFLSNSGPEMMAKVRADHPLATFFDVVVISCEVGLSKPDPRIYRHCLERLGLPAPEALFVDDRADNIEGAARVGLETMHFDGPDALDRLRARLLLAQR
jgi:putative hydrolase of the HAD superfamily